MMIHQGKIKYQPLKTSDDDSCTENADHQITENVSVLSRVHWLIKSLFIVLIIIQMIYMGRDYSVPKLFKSESKSYFDNTTIYFEETTKSYEEIYITNSVWNISLNDIQTTFANNELENTLTSTSFPKLNQSQTNQISVNNSINNKSDFNITLTGLNVTTSSPYNGTNTISNQTTTSTPKLQTTHETQNLTSNTSIANYLNKTSIKPKANSTATTNIIQWQTSTITSLPANYSTKKPVVQQVINTMNSDRNNSDHLKMTNRQYFINTSQCRMPYIDPFTPEVRKIFHPTHTTDCTKDEAIISVNFDEVKGQYVLYTNYTVAMELSRRNSNEASILDDLRCCYRQIERNGHDAKADTSYTLLPCTNFHQNFLVPVHVQGVIIDCFIKSQKPILQQDAFSFIQIKSNDNENRNESKKENSTKKSNVPRKFGVLLLGIDSLSRINFRRNMPETYSYLLKNGWYELQGYNKVGDNTLPNLMPLLTGYTKKTTNSKCKPTNVGGLDNCNFIWQKFHDIGFKTAYAEDTSFISTFNYHMKGFLKPPTDHYFRPIALATEHEMKKTTKAGLNYCIGRRQAGEYIYDYGLEFVTRYRNLSNFGFFWTNSFSHNSFSTAATMDSKMTNYLRELELRGIFEQSVVAFFSDHGRRWGPLLKLSEGFLEERLPMFFISLPPWMKREFPNYVNNLKINQKRLTTPFDIHMTLQELLHLADPKYKPILAYDCPKAQSIFNEIPENRTCATACIPEVWCACITYMPVSTHDALVKRVTQLIIDKMNNYFSVKNITSICSKLSLNQISQAKIRDDDTVTNTLTYMIEFSTNPITKPPTVFSATVNYDRVKDSIEMDVEEVARHSKYETTAKCIDDKQAKKYCICLDSLENKT